jgi:hypothetical protein
MSHPELDPVTAESEEQDSDFGDEHDDTSLADEHQELPGSTDESTPRGTGGLDPA